MKKILLTLCFYLLFGCMNSSQAATVSYSFPSNTISYYSYYPSLYWYYPFWNSANAPSFRHKRSSKGGYYAWKRNNIAFQKMAEQKMLTYNEIHAQGQNINPLDDPQFLNDVKVYSLPTDPKITVTPETAVKGAAPQIQTPSQSAK